MYKSDEMKSILMYVKESKWSVEKRKFVSKICFMEPIYQNDNSKQSKSSFHYTYIRAQSYSLRKCVKVEKALNKFSIFAFLNLYFALHFSSIFPQYFHTCLRRKFHFPLLHISLHYRGVGFWQGGGKIKLRLYTLCITQRVICKMDTKNIREFVHVFSSAHII